MHLWSRAAVLISCFKPTAHLSLFFIYAVQNGNSALSIARRLGYISVVDTLKVVTEETLTTQVRIRIFWECVLRKLFLSFLYFNFNKNGHVHSPWIQSRMMLETGSNSHFSKSLSGYFTTFLLEVSLICSLISCRCFDYSSNSTVPPCLTDIVVNPAAN